MVASMLSQLVQTCLSNTCRFNWYTSLDRCSCLSHCVCLYLSVCLSHCVCLSLSLSVCLTVYVSVCVCQSVCLTVYVSVCVCVSVCLTVYVSVCLCLSVSLRMSLKCLFYALIDEVQNWHKSFTDADCISASVILNLFSSPVDEHTSVFLQLDWLINMW